MYWRRTDSLLDLIITLLLSVGWGLGGWLLVRHVFHLRLSERLPVGLAAGFILFISLIGLLGVAILYTFIMRGQAIFDEYLHLPQISTMAAGDISRALAFPFTLILGWLLLRRLTGNRMGASLGAILLGCGGGTNWYLLLLPSSWLDRVSQHTRLDSFGWDTVGWITEC